MAPRADLEWLLDTIASAADLSDFASDMELPSFRSLPHSNRILYRAMKNALMELGEAINRIPKEIKERHPEIRWRQFSDLRNVVAHGYFRIDMDLLHPVVANDLPNLIKVIDAEILILNGCGSDKRSHEADSGEDAVCPKL